MNTTTEFFAPLNASLQVPDLDDPAAGDEPAETVEPIVSVPARPRAQAMLRVIPPTAASERTIPPASITANTPDLPTSVTTAPPPPTTAPAAPAAAEEQTVAVADASVTPTTAESNPERCSIGFAVNLGPMTDSALTAISQLNQATSNIDLIAGGDISISFGGEWPTDSAPLGWTSGDGTQILINPDHPYANEPSVILEIVTHELGHVFIGPQHVSDGSILDPQLNGQVMFSNSDRATLSAVTCADLGYG